jgi:hypothetical protein
LATGASRSKARRCPPRRTPRSASCSSARHLRYALPLHGRSPFRSCVSLHSRWPVHGRTFTFGWMLMLGVLCRDSGSGDRTMNPAL